MIKNSTLSAIQPLVDRLATVPELSLEPIAGTPLAAVVEVAMSSLGDQSVSTLQDASCTKNAVGVCEHDVAMDTYVEAAAQVVRDTLKIARTVVNPMVSAVTQEVQAIVDGERQKAINPLSILVDDTPDIFSSTALVGLIERYREAPLEDTKIQRVFPAMASSDLAAYIRTGSAVLDREVDAYLGTAKEAILQRVYQTLFEARDFYGESFATQLLEYVNPKTWAQEVLVTHLFATRFSDNIPEGVSMPLADYREYLSIVQQQSGRVLNRIIEERAYADKSGKLVLASPSVSIAYITDPADGIIRVNGAVYSSWLEKGGTPEALFGSFLRNGVRVVDVDTMVAEQSANVAEWNRYSALLESQQKANFYQSVIRAIKTAVAKQIVELSEEYVVVTGKEVYQDRLTQCLNEVTDKDLEDIYHCIRHVVCYTMFQHTNAEEVLVAIDEEGLRNPSMEPREAALVATVRVVSDWVSKLYTVKL